MGYFSAGGVCARAAIRNNVKTAMAIVSLFFIKGKYGIKRRFPSGHPLTLSEVTLCGLKKPFFFLEIVKSTYLYIEKAGAENSDLFTTTSLKTGFYIQPEKRTYGHRWPQYCRHCRELFCNGSTLSRLRRQIRLALLIIRLQRHRLCRTLLLPPRKCQR